MKLPTYRQEQEQILELESFMNQGSNDQKKSDLTVSLGLRETG